MCPKKLPFARRVKLLADYQGYPDGRLVMFEVWRQDGSKKEKLYEVTGVTKGGKAIGWWTPSVRQKSLPLEKEIKENIEEIKYYFVAKIDDKETKSEDMVFTYPLEVFLVDEKEVPIDDAECTITFSDGSKEKQVAKSGRVRFNEALQGKFEIEVQGYEFVFQPLGKILRARWGREKAKCDENVKMIVDTKDFEDGTVAKFEIWEETIDKRKDLIDQLEGVVEANRVETNWSYSTSEVVEDSKKEEEGQPKYYFFVDIEGEKARSTALTLTYLLRIFLKDNDGNPLDEVPYTVILSDGTEKKGKFKNGWAEVQDATFGDFHIEIEGSEITLE